MAPLLEQVGWWLAAVLPLVILAGLVLLLLGRGPGSAPETVFPIVRAPLEDARGVFEKRRLKHALEAQRLLSGRWPADLAGSDPTGLLEAGSLTPEGAAPYYYVKRGRDVVLLAPER